MVVSISIAEPIAKAIPIKQTKPDKSINIILERTDIFIEFPEEKDMSLVVDLQFPRDKKAHVEGLELLYHPCGTIIYAKSLLVVDISILTH